MRLGPAVPSGLSKTGCIVLPAALFIALMLASAGVAIWPRMAAPGAAILCGGGEVIYESHGASYRPGEYTVTRTLYCQTGEGKNAQRDEITFQAAGLSFLIYSVIVFLLLQFVVRPLLRRRVSRTLEAVRGAAPAGLGATASAADLGAILGRVSEAVKRGAARVEVHDLTHGAPGDDEVAQRLAQLRELRDHGLITAQDYDAKKAEILSRL
jgi:hypothetical protein